MLFEVHYNYQDANRIIRMEWFCNLVGSMWGMNKTLQMGNHPVWLSLWKNALGAILWPALWMYWIQLLNLPERLCLKIWWGLLGCWDLKTFPNRINVIKGGYIIWLGQSLGMLIRSLSASSDRNLSHRTDGVAVGIKATEARSRLSVTKTCFLSFSVLFGFIPSCFKDDCCQKSKFLHSDSDIIEGSPGRTDLI